MSDFTARSGEGGWGAARADPITGIGLGGAGVTSPGLNWTTAQVADDPGVLHSLGIPEVPGRLLRFCSPRRAAVVLGRAEPSAHIDLDRVGERGLEVVRRSSGGGAVLVVPGGQVWADLVVPRHDPLWDADVGRAAWWVGEVWARALGALGAPDLDVHRSGLVRRPWSDRICYAGLGAGEVSSAGRKLVGVAARRTRAGALFQCGLLLDWQPGALIDVLCLDDLPSDGNRRWPGPTSPSRERRARAVFDDVVGAAVGLRQLAGNDISVTDVQSALVAELPD